MRCGRSLMSAGGCCCCCHRCCQPVVISHLCERAVRDRNRASWTALLVLAVSRIGANAPPFPWGVHPLAVGHPPGSGLGPPDEGGAPYCLNDLRQVGPSLLGLSWPMARGCAPPQPDTDSGLGSSRSILEPEAPPEASKSRELKSRGAGLPCGVQPERLEEWGTSLLNRGEAPRSNGSARVAVRRWRVLTAVLAASCPACCSCRAGRPPCCQRYQAERCWR